MPRVSFGRFDAHALSLLRIGGEFTFSLHERNGPARPHCVCALVNFPARDRDFQFVCANRNTLAQSAPGLV